MADSTKEYAWYLEGNKIAIVEKDVNFDNNAGIVINDDNDGIAFAGETLGLSIPLINYGSETATNFSATLSTTSNQVIIDNATVTYDSIFSGTGVVTGL